MTAYIWCEAVGFMLLHFVWQAAVIAGLYKAVTLLGPRMTPQSRYSLGLMALLAMAGAGGVTLWLEQARLSAVIAPVTAGTARQAGLDLSAILPWLDGAWLIGVAGFSVRLMLGLSDIQRLAAGWRPAPEAVARRFATTLKRLGLAGRVYLRLHPRIDGPFVVGVIRSVVYLPVSAVSDLSPDQLDAVIAHELEHIRRADFAWNLAQTLMETLFFYHPLVWWLSGQLREQRELCCDDAAVKTCRDPLVYATALFSLAQSKRGVPALAMAIGHCDTSSSLVRRMGRILGETAPAKPKTRGMLLGAWAPFAPAMACLGLLVLMAGLANHPANQAPAVEAAVTRQTPSVTSRPPGHDMAVLKRHRDAIQAVDLAPQPMPQPVAASPDVLPLLDTSRLIAKVTGGGHVTYLFDGHPATAGLQSFLQKDHIFQFERIPPGSHARVDVVIAPLTSKDGDYTAGKPAAGVSNRLYKVVVTKSVSTAPLLAQPASQPAATS